MSVGTCIGSRIGTRVGVRIGAPYVSSGTPVLVSIEITPDTASVVAGATQQFTATGTYSDTSTADLTATATWDTSDHAKATISAGGLLTAITIGTCTVSATVGAISDSSGTITITVPKDGPSNWYVPTTSAHFTGLGITTPGSVWACQEASGNLADSLGSVTLTAAGSPSYQQALPAGWTRKGVLGTSSAGKKFAAASGTGPNPGTTSSLWLFYIQITAAPAAVRCAVFASDNAVNCEARVTTTPAYRCTCNAVDATGASNAGTTAVRPVALKYDRANGVVKVYTDQEVVTGTYNATVADGNKGLGSSGIANVAALAAWGCMWSGAAAELSDAQVKTRLQSLGITIPW